MLTKWARKFSAIGSNSYFEKVKITNINFQL